MSDQEFLVKGAADYLKVSAVTVYRLVAAGRLRYQKKANKLRFKRAWLDEYNERTTFSPITSRTKAVRS
jgi:excisionase family DNA binding protein